MWCIQNSCKDYDGINSKKGNRFYVFVRFGKLTVSVLRIDAIYNQVDNTTASFIRYGLSSRLCFVALLKGV